MITIIKNLESCEGLYGLLIDGWSFPLEELDYLLETHSGETFLLVDNRLYEVEEVR